MAHIVSEAQKCCHKAGQASPSPKCCSGNAVTSALQTESLSCPCSPLLPDRSPRSLHPHCCVWEGSWVTLESNCTEAVAQAGILLLWTVAKGDDVIVPSLVFECHGLRMSCSESRYLQCWCKGKEDSRESTEHSWILLQQVFFPQWPKTGGNKPLGSLWVACLVTALVLTVDDSMSWNVSWANKCCCKGPSGAISHTLCSSSCFAPVIQSWVQHFQAKQEVWGKLAKWEEWNLFEHCKMVCKPALTVFSFLLQLRQLIWKSGWGWPKCQRALPRAKLAHPILGVEKLHVHAENLLMPFTLAEKLCKSRKPHHFLFVSDLPKSLSDPTAQNKLFFVVDVVTVVTVVVVHFGFILLIVWKYFCSVGGGRELAFLTGLSTLQTSETCSNWLNICGILLPEGAEHSVFKILPPPQVASPLLNYNAQNSCMGSHNCWNRFEVGFSL